jgi:hypothetical protein
MNRDFQQPARQTLADREAFGNARQRLLLRLPGACDIPILFVGTCAFFIASVIGIATVFKTKETSANSP